MSERNTHSGSGVHPKPKKRSSKQSRRKYKRCRSSNSDSFTGFSEEDFRTSCFTAACSNHYLVDSSIEEIRLERECLAVEGLTCFKCNMTFSSVSHHHIHKIFCSNKALFVPGKTALRPEHEVLLREPCTNMLACPWCPLLSSTMPMLEEHLFKCREAFKRKQAESVKHEMPCPECFKKFVDMQTLLSHLQTHYLQDLMCDPCDKVFPNRSSLIEHLSNCNHLVMQRCSDCRQAFCDGLFLKAHVSSCNINLQCLKCACSTLKRDGSLMHMEKHLKEEWMAMGFQYADGCLNLLKDAMEKQTDEKDFKSCPSSTFAELNPVKDKMKSVTEAPLGNLRGTTVVDNIPVVGFVDLDCEENETSDDEIYIVEKENSRVEKIVSTPVSPFWKSCTTHRSTKTIDLNKTRNEQGKTGETSNYFTPAECSTSLNDVSEGLHLTVVNVEGAANLFDWDDCDAVSNVLNEEKNSNGVEVLNLESNGSCAANVLFGTNDETAISISSTDSMNGITSAGSPIFISSSDSCDGREERPQTAISISSTDTCDNLDQNNEYNILCDRIKSNCAKEDIANDISVDNGNKQLKKDKVSRHCQYHNLNKTSSDILESSKSNELKRASKLSSSEPNLEERLRSASSELQNDSYSILLNTSMTSKASNLDNSINLFQLNDVPSSPAEKSKQKSANSINSNPSKEAKSSGKSIKALCSTPNEQKVLFSPLIEHTYALKHHFNVSSKLRKTLHYKASKGHPSEEKKKVNCENVKSSTVLTKSMEPIVEVGPTSDYETHFLKSCEPPVSANSNSKSEVVYRKNTMSSAGSSPFFFEHGSVSEVNHQYNKSDTSAELVNSHESKVTSKVSKLCSPATSSRNCRSMPKTGSNMFAGQVISSAESSKMLTSTSLTTALPPHQTERKSCEENASPSSSSNTYVAPYLRFVNVKPCHPYTIKGVLPSSLGPKTVQELPGHAVSLQMPNGKHALKCVPVKSSRANEASSSQLQLKPAMVWKDKAVQFSAPAYSYTRGKTNMKIVNNLITEASASETASERKKATSLSSSAAKETIPPAVKFGTLSDVSDSVKQGAQRSRVAKQGPGSANQVYTNVNHHSAYDWKSAMSLHSPSNPSNIKQFVTNQDRESLNLLNGIPTSGESTPNGLVRLNEPAVPSKAVSCSQSHDTRFSNSIDLLIAELTSVNNQIKHPIQGSMYTEEGLPSSSSNIPKDYGGTTQQMVSNKLPAEVQSDVEAQSGTFSMPSVEESPNTTNSSKLLPHNSLFLSNKENSVPGRSKETVSVDNKLPLESSSIGKQRKHHRSSREELMKALQTAVPNLSNYNIVLMESSSDEESEEEVIAANCAQMDSSIRSHSPTLRKELQHTESGKSEKNGTGSFPHSSELTNQNNNPLLEEKVKPCQSVKTHFPSGGKHGNNSPYKANITNKKVSAANEGPMPSLIAQEEYSCTQQLKSDNFVRQQSLESLKSIPDKETKIPCENQTMNSFKKQDSFLHLNCNNQADHMQTNICSNSSDSAFSTSNVVVLLVEQKLNDCWRNIMEANSPPVSSSQQVTPQNSPLRGECAVGASLVKHETSKTGGILLVGPEDLPGECIIKSSATQNQIGQVNTNFHFEKEGSRCAPFNDYTNQNVLGDPFSSEETQILQVVPSAFCVDHRIKDVSNSLAMDSFESITPAAYPPSPSELFVKSVDNAEKHFPCVSPFETKSTAPSHISCQIQDHKLTLMHCPDNAATSLESTSSSVPCPSELNSGTSNLACTSIIKELPSFSEAGEEKSCLGMKLKSAFPIQEKTALCSGNVTSGVNRLIEVEIQRQVAESPKVFVVNHFDGVHNDVPPKISEIKEPLESSCEVRSTSILNDKLFMVSSAQTSIIQSDCILGELSESDIAVFGSSESRAVTTTSTESLVSNHEHDWLMTNTAKLCEPSVEENSKPKTGSPSGFGNMCVIEQSCRKEKSVTHDLPVVTQTSKLSLPIVEDLRKPTTEKSPGHQTAFKQLGGKESVPDLGSPVAIQTSHTTISTLKGNNKPINDGNQIVIEQTCIKDKTLAFVSHSDGELLEEKVSSLGKATSIESNLKSKNVHLKLLSISNKGKTSQHTQGLERRKCLFRQLLLQLNTLKRRRPGREALSCKKNSKMMCEHCGLYAQDEIELHLSTCLLKIWSEKVARDSEVTERHIANNVTSDINPLIPEITNEKNNLKTKQRRGFVCLDCHICFPNFSAFKQHRIKVHHEEKEIVCHVCQKGFDHIQKLAVHYSRSHPAHISLSEFPMSSNHGEVFDGKSFLKLRNNQRKRFRATSSKNPEKRLKYSCSVCCLRFKKKVQLRFHLQQHKTYKEFNCPVCCKTFSHKNNLELMLFNLHVKMCKHGDKSQKSIKALESSTIKCSTFVCFVCIQNFNSEVQLCSHLFNEHGNVRKRNNRSGHKKIQSAPELCNGGDSGKVKQAGEICDVQNKESVKSLTPADKLVNSSTNFPCCVCFQIYGSEELLRSHVCCNQEKGLVDAQIVVDSIFENRTGVSFPATCLPKQQNNSLDPTSSKIHNSAVDCGSPEVTVERIISAQDSQISPQLNDVSPNCQDEHLEHISCPKCYKSCKSRVAFSQHFHRQHGTLVKVVCPICHRKFNHEVILKGHLEKIHKKKHYQLPFLTVPAKHNNQNSSVNIINHPKSGSSHLPAECELNNASISSISSANLVNSSVQSLQTICNESQTKCAQCIVSHECKAHQNKFQCNHCWFNFNSGSALSTHDCILQTKETVNTRNQKTSNSCHSRESNVSFETGSPDIFPIGDGACNVEDQKLLSKSTEAVELSVEKPSYTCGDCHVSYEIYSCLKQHRTEVHKEVPEFYCSECSKGFSHSHTLKSHMEHFHASSFDTKDHQSMSCLQDSETSVDFEAGCKQDVLQYSMKHKLFALKPYDAFPEAHGIVPKTVNHNLDQNHHAALLPLNCKLKAECKGGKQTRSPSPLQRSLCWKPSLTDLVSLTSYFDSFYSSAATKSFESNCVSSSLVCSELQAASDNILQATSQWSSDSTNLMIDLGGNSVVHCSVCGVCVSSVIALQDHYSSHISSYEGPGLFE